MEKLDINYSLKNIPIPNNESYLKSLMKKIEEFLTRMRWKAFFFEKGENEDDNDENEVLNNYGFKSEKTPPQNMDLLAFENDLFGMVTDITFKSKPETNFQKKIISDVKKINASDSILVNADKTTNIYKIKPDEYKTLLNENITKNYQKTNDDMIKGINVEAQKIAEKLELDGRIEGIAKKPAFLTIKDHKPNFPNTIQCRLINPAKSEIGKISREYLQKITYEIKTKTNLTQWRNTDEVIDWFNNIENKQNQKFFQLDIKDFYPSITETLLDKSLKYASKITHIDKGITDTIVHCRKSLLFDFKDTWVKTKDGDEDLFDVTMGSYDGAEVCELVGLYLLNRFKETCPEVEFGLYRDDGLGYSKKMRGRTTEKMRQKIIQMFKKEGLNIIIDMDMDQVDFLDVTFNVNTDRYGPFNKPNNKPMYVHSKSNHPKSILKQIPISVNDRLNRISCDEQAFNQKRDEYQKALEDSEYKHKLSYKKADKKDKSKRQRKRKIIWFNPPFNSNINEKIGKKFFQMLEQRFPEGHKFRKIFNKNTIKLSYSCMPNIDKIIKSHNNKVLRESVKGENERECSCREEAKNECPLGQKCLSKNIVYQATVKTNDGNEEVYIGSCSTTFKERLGNHKYSFTHEDSKHRTRLSTYMWEVQDKDPVITWKILKHSKEYVAGSRCCALCLDEKYEILKNKKCLNLKSEFFGTCRHTKKHKLSDKKQQKKRKRK